MNKELNKKLRDMQANPTSGTAHNAQVVSTQVETIFMLDSLKEQIEKLNKSIELSDKQNHQLEISNYRLQWAMLVLTFVATMVIVAPIIQNLLNSLWPSILQIFKIDQININVINIINILTLIISASITASIIFYSEKSVKNEMKRQTKLYNKISDDNKDLNEKTKSTNTD